MLQYQNECWSAYPDHISDLISLYPTFIGRLRITPVTSSVLPISVCWPLHQLLRRPQETEELPRLSLPRLHHTCPPAYQQKVPSYLNEHKLILQSFEDRKPLVTSDCSWSECSRTMWGGHKWILHKSIDTEKERLICSLWVWGKSISGEETLCIKEHSECSWRALLINGVQ